MDGQVSTESHLLDALDQCAAEIDQLIRSIGRNCAANLDGSSQIRRCYGDRLRLRLNLQHQKLFEWHFRWHFRERDAHRRAVALAAP